MNTENYYKPFCPRCNKYVEPQVVSATQVSGGYNNQGVTSRVSYKKMCPSCGNQVFSEEDMDAFKVQKQKSILLYGILSFLCFSIFAAIPTLIVASKNRPLNMYGKVGVGLASVSLVQLCAFFIFGWLTHWRFFK